MVRMAHRGAWQRFEPAEKKGHAARLRPWVGGARSCELVVEYGQPSWYHFDIDLENGGTPMPDVLVRDVDADALGKLKDRARRNGRSLGAELKIVVEQAARQVDMMTARALAEEMTRRLGGRPHSDSTELLREDRLR
jgi:hypothetical protein